MAQSANLGFVSQLQFNHARSSQITERDLSLPTLVSIYRSFSTDAVRWWRDRHNGQGRVVIGIDELDKIASTESAENFLNQIKTLFGVPGCLYIVSTSEDALIQFERKALGFRSAFDSAFDDIIRVDTLTLLDTQQLLLKRLAGVGNPFITLCYVFSGGLSRDVLRTARTIVEARCNNCVSLKEVGNFLILREIVDFKNALLAGYGGDNISDARGHIAGSVVASLLDDQWPGKSSSELLFAATPALKATSPELYTVLCFLATIYDLVADENRDSWEGYFVEGVMQNGVADLCAARRWLHSEPETALQLVQAARGKLSFGPIVNEEAC
jgi:hypothetical protein